MSSGIELLTQNPESEKGYKNPKSYDSDGFSFTDIVSLTYLDQKGVTRSGIITIELQFAPSTLSIDYIDVHYSDAQLEKQIESNPNVLRNIDSYLRNKLLKLQYNI